MICVDKPQRYGRRLWCHLWDDGADTKALHEFARRIGLKLAWFQPRLNFDHYDLYGGKIAAARTAGAKLASLREYVERVLGKPR